MSEIMDTGQFRNYIEKFYVLPPELKNDIVYCQRALRDFIKVHSLVSEVFNEQADADPVQMRRILDELEDEIYEINAEHQFLMLRLNEGLDELNQKLKEKNIAILPGVVDEFVSNQIVPLIADLSYKISPKSVMSRDNEEMLIRKHFLLSQDDEAGMPPLKLSDLDENIPLVLAPHVVGLGHQIAAASVLPLQSQCQTLLIRKTDVGESSSSVKKKNISSTSPPPLAPITPTVVAPQNPPFEAGAEDQKPSNLQYALKRARKTKQQPLQCCDEEVMELTSLETSRLKSSRENTRDSSPLSLPPAASQKVNKNNTAASQAQSNALAKKAAPPMPVQVPTKNRNYGRKSSPNLPSNSQPQPQPQPTGSTSGSSDDSSAELQQEQQRLVASAAQWRDEPRETRILPDEYGQEAFLRLFGLYTPEVLKKLNQRHSKRKRRTVQNASGVDFHYGQQLNAMETLVLGLRGHKKAKEKDRPEFLLSPKEKRLQAKRAYNRKSKSPDKATPDVAEMPCQHCEGSPSKCRKCRECKECKRRVEREPVALCQICSGYYHIECHERPKSSKQIHIQSIRCPSCLREQSEGRR